MTVQGINWLTPLKTERAEEAGHKKVAKKKDLVAPRIEAQGLPPIDLPKGIAAKHAPVLSTAAQDIVALNALASGQDWRSKSFSRVVEQFYKTLGHSLDLLPTKPGQTELATRSVSAFRSLAEELLETDHLLPGAGAALGLVDHAVRLASKRAIELSNPEVLSLFEDATADVRTLRSDLNGRFGVGRALNLLPLLTEQLERAFPPATKAARQQTREVLRTFLNEVPPDTGIDPAGAAQLARSVAMALDAEPKSIKKTLAQAKDNFFAIYDDRRVDVRRQLQQEEQIENPGKERFQELNKAFEQVLDAHPTGPDSLYEHIFAVRGKFQDELRWGREEPVHQPLIGLINKFAGTPFADRFLQWVGENLRSLQNKKDAPQFMKRALAAKSITKTASILAEFSLPRTKQGLKPKAQKEVDRITKLSPAAAMSCFFAVQSLAKNADLPSLLGYVRQFAQSNAHDDPLAFSVGVGHRTWQSMRALSTNKNCSGQPKLTKTLVPLLVEASANTRDPENAIATTCRLMKAVQRVLPKASVESLIADDGGPGLFSLAAPSVPWRKAIGQVLGKVLNALDDVPSIKKATVVEQTRIARFALDLAATVANLEGKPGIPTRQILADLEQAFRTPGKLQYDDQAAKKAVAARAKPSVAQFARTYPEIPLELVLTAGVHLSAEQVGWIKEKCSGVKGRDTLRSLRDFVFACLNAEKKDFIDVVRESKADSKALSAVVRYIGTQYRENKLKNLPWDEIGKRLKKGEDPVEELQQKKANAAVAGFNLAVKEVDPAGMEELSRCAEAIRNITDHMKGHQEDGINCKKRLSGIWTEVLQSVADGSWPAAKYESKESKKNLAILTPAQQEIWKTENVTELAGGGGGGVVPVAVEVNVDQRDMADLNRAYALMKGVSKTLAKDPSVLQIKGFDKLTWSKASLKKVEKAYNEQLEILRKFEKGKKKHAAATKKIVPLRNTLALLRFQLGFKQTKGAPQNVLAVMRGNVKDALGAFTRMGHRNMVEALSEVDLFSGSLKAVVKAASRGGTYAADEDNLYALITSTAIGGGCCSHSSYRRYTNVGFAANAQEKFVRSYVDGKPVVRALLKLIEAKIDKYNGPVLWLNNTNYGGNDQAKKLLVQHAVSKAKLMGIPIISGETSLASGAQALGLKEQRMQAKVRVMDNRTGTSFDNYTAIPMSQHDIRTYMGKKSHYEGSSNCYVVMPK